MKRLLIALALASTLLGGAAPAQSGDAWNPYYRRASDILEAGDPEGAIRPAKEALAYSERTDGPESMEALLCLTLLSECHVLLRQYAELEQASGRAVAILRKFPDQRGLLESHLGRLARAYHWQGKFQEAEPIYAEEAVLREQDLLQGDSPPTPYYFETLQGLALVRMKLEKRFEVIAPMRMVLSAAAGVPADSSRLATEAIGILATYLLQLDRSSWVDSLLEETVRVAERRFAKNVRAVAHSRAALGVNRLSLGRYADAERRIRQALAELERAYGPKDPDVLSAYEMLVALYVRSDRAEEAEAISKRTGVGQ